MAERVPQLSSLPHNWFMKRAGRLRARSPMRGVIPELDQRTRIPLECSKGWQAPFWAAFSTIFSSSIVAFSVDCRDISADDGEWINVQIKFREIMEIAMLKGAAEIVMPKRAYVFEKEFEFLLETICFTAVAMAAQYCETRKILHRESLEHLLQPTPVDFS